MVKIVDWNIGFTRQPWRELVEMDADVALLQETCNPPQNVADQVQLSPYAHWLGEEYPLRSLIPARLYAKFRGSNGCDHVGTPPLVAGVGGFFTIHGKR